jgi:non-specific serine/threonine protein kinase
VGAPGPLRIFISYRRQDAAPYAGRLHGDLIERFGEEQVFIDVEGIGAGEDFEQVIVGTIESADVLLAVVRPEWLASVDDHSRRRLDLDDDYVRKELEVALGGDVRVIPVLVADARMPAPQDLPDSLAAFSRRQAVILSDRRWRADLAELVGELDRLAARKSGVDPGRSPVGTPPSVARRRGPPLPRHRTRFVGRRDEMKAIVELLDSTGFVTVVGTGGVGKSRLAIELGSTIEARYADGVGLAELAPVDDPLLIVPAVARATGVDGPDVDSVDALVQRLADRQVLLILDNCEHLIDDAAALAEALVQRCPAVHLLATSRETLQVDGEAVWRLEPLLVPDAGPGVTAVDLTDYPSAMLFADRATLAAPAFTLDDRSAPAVARIAAALDGLPLALELAASALRSVALDDVLDGLAARFATAGAQRRTSQARQRTLWATVDWSYQLLDEGERLLFERLGVFAGSFSTTSVMLVCGGGLAPEAVTATMSQLVERSLVTPVDDDGASGRFRLLYAVRDHARERHGERAGDDTAERFRMWAVDVAEEHGRAVDSGDELAGLAVLDVEHPNLVAALAQALDASDGTTASRLAAALTPYWELRGLSADSRGWVERALAIAPADDALLAACRLAAARLLPTAEFEQRRQWCRGALEAAERAGDDRLASIALASLGHIDLENEQRASGRDLVQAALGRARVARDDAATAVALGRLALCEQNDGDAVAQQQLLGEAIALFEKLGNRRGQLWSLAEIGFASLAANLPNEAEPAFRRGLDLARQLGYPHGEAWMLDALGEAAGAAARFAESRAHFVGADAIQQELRDDLNRGWTLGGLIRADLGLGDLAGAMRWLGQFARLQVTEVAALYEYALLLRAGSVAAAAGHAEVAARLLGAMEARDAPPQLSPTDLADREALERTVVAALDPAELQEERRRGRDAAPLELVQPLLDLRPPS